MKLLALLFVSLASAGQKTVNVPILGLPTALPTAAPGLTLPSFLAPVSVAPVPATGLQALKAAQAATPRNAKPLEPQKLAGVYDGSGGPTAQAPAAFEPAPFAFQSQPVEAQLSNSGWYGARVSLTPWSAAREGEGWLKFYHALYKSLSVNAPTAYRQETPSGPVFHLGGHDVAQAILGVGRTRADGEVNLYGRVESAEANLALWTTVEVDGATRGKLEIDINPESSHSLARMRLQPPAGEALDRVQDNVFLKWNLVSLTPEGLVVRGLDTRSAEDLRQRSLRLSTTRGPLSGYEAHYNLIVAYRALRETGRPWRIDSQTRRLIARSLREMPKQALDEALERAAESPSLRGDGPPQTGMRRLVEFIGREFGPAAGARAENAARELPGERGGFLEEGVPQALLDAAKPFRTQSQLKRLYVAPPKASGGTSFSLIGDAEPGRFWISRVLFNIRGVFERMARRADKDGSEFVVQLGDMVSRGTPANYERFFGLLSSLKLAKPYLTVLGNHDRARPHGVSHSRLYRALFGPETDYAFERGGARFVALDSSAGRVTPQQLAWLDEQLDFAGPKILFTHMPPAYLAEWTDVPGVKKGAGGFKKGAQGLREILERRGVSRVYMGHIHALDALEKGGVRYVLTGGGGSALFPLFMRRAARKFHHYLRVEVDEKGRITETVRRDDGSSFELKWPP